MVLLMVVAVLLLPCYGRIGPMLWGRPFFYAYHRILYYATNAATNVVVSSMTSPLSSLKPLP